VAIGANGSASMFTGTAYTGSSGASSTVTGQQHACAAIGTARTAASTTGSRRANRAVRGGPSTTIPAVASTDNANAKDRATHGSATSMPIAASATSGSPCTGRPCRCTTRTTTAITVARTIDGSGRTSTTKPRSTATASPARRSRGARHARPMSKTSATSTAQFDPDTAVRWVSAVSSIAADVSASIRDRSPIASPPRSPPPGIGSVAVTRANAERAVSVAARRPDGPVRTWTDPRANSTIAALDSDGSGCSSPRTESTLPAAMRSPDDDRSGTTRTGTPPAARRVPATSSARTVPANERSPGATSRSATSSTLAVAPPPIAVRTGPGLRRSHPAATATATSPTSSAATAASDTTARSAMRPVAAVDAHNRASTNASVATARPPPSATGTAVPGTATSTAAAAHATATGAASRRSAPRSATPITPAPGVRVRRSGRRRCR
jgi:hypothetical protein